MLARSLAMCVCVCVYVRVIYIVTGHIACAAWGSVRGGGAAPAAGCAGCQGTYLPVCIVLLVVRRML